MIIPPGEIVQDRQPFIIPRLRYPGWAWVGSSHFASTTGLATITGTARGFSPVGVTRGFGSTLGVGTTDSIVTAEKVASAKETLVIFYKANGAGGGNFGRLLQKGTTTNGEESIIVSTATGSPRLIWHRTNSSGTNLFSGFITDNSITDGAFHTLVLVSDGTVSTPLAYQDGVKQTYVSQSASTTNAANSTDPFWIGNRPSDSARVWDGYVAFVARMDMVASEEFADSLSLNPWQVLEPEDSNIIIIGGVGSHSASGALAGSAGTVSGTATHYTLHSSSGVLSGGSGTVAGTATHLTLHSTSGALSGSAGEISGTAARWHAFSASGDLVGSSGVIEGSATLTVGGEHGASGDLAGNSGVVSGTASHLTLHTSSGALSGSFGELSGVAAHYVLHSTSGTLSGPSGVVAGTAVHSGPGAQVSGGGGGTQKKRKKLAVLEVDGNEYVIPANDIQSFLNSLVKPDKKKAKKQEIKKPAPVVAPEVRIVEVAPEIERVVVQKVDRTNELLLAAWNRAIERELEEEEELIWLLVA